MAYYTPSGQPALDNRGISAQVRSEFALIAAGFALLPVSAAIFGGYSNYYAATGSASAFAITVSANVTTIPDGATFLVTAPATNTGALTIAVSYAPTPTLIGTYSVVRPDNTALVAGDWVSGQIGQISFNVTSGKFQLALSGMTAANSAATSAAASAASASASAGSASASATSATASAGSATAAAASATLAANYLTVGTSTSGVAIATGAKSFTATAGKAWGAGQFLTLASAANTANYMHGTVTSYNATTGALVMNILDVGGSGTFADWGIGVTGTRGPSGPAGTPTVVRSARTSNTILGLLDSGALIDITSGTFSQTFSAAAVLTSGWWVYLHNSGTGDITLTPNGVETIDGLTSYVMYPGEVRLVQCDGSTLRTVVLQPFYRAFTASGTFTKPPGYSLFEGLGWGAGGGGGNTASAIAGGGGGAAGVPFKLLATAVGTTETITIAAASAAQAAGGNSTFGSLVTAFGGGAASGLTGGGGSGVLGLASGATGGSPRSGATDQDFGGADAANPPKAAVYGGGGGGSSANNTGGASWYGAGGGGASNASVAGIGGVSKFGGSGGASTLTGTAGTGGAGSAPGGGGGGGDTGGGGARGEIRVWGVV